LTFGNFDYIGATGSLNNFADNFDKDDVIMINGNKKFSDALQLGLKYYYTYEALSPFFMTITDKEFKNFYYEMHKRNKRLILIYDNEELINRMEKFFDMNHTKGHLDFYTFLNGKLMQTFIPINMYIVNNVKQ
jgi:hypothetical protein